MTTLAPKRPSAGSLASVFFAMLVFVVIPAWAWFIEPRLLLVREVKVTSPDLPAAFDGVRVAFLTDLHRGPAISEGRVREVVKKTNSLNPDLVLLGGDYTSAGPKYIASGIAPLAGLRARLGKFAVLGNHDHWYSAPQTRAALVAAGIRVIDNDGEWVAAESDRGKLATEVARTPELAAEFAPTARIRVGGVGDLWEDTPDLSAALDGAQPADFVILISHNPDYSLKLPPDGPVDLMFAGHTHGGQVTLFGLYAPVLPIEGGQRLRSGVRLQDKTTIIVSRGVGLIAPHVRFFCPPEIVVVTLNRGPEFATLP